MSVRSHVVYTLDSVYMSNPALAAWQSFLDRAPQAHIIDIHARIDGTDYTIQADFLKHVKRKQIIESPEPEEEYQGGHWQRHLFNVDGSVK